MEEDIENLIEELTKVRPEMLNEEALKLFNTIMAALDDRDNLKERLKEEIEQLKMKLAENSARTLNSDLKQKYKHEEDLEALHLGWKDEMFKLQARADRLKTNNEILQGELDRIGVKTLKLEAGSSTDDVIAEIEKKDKIIDLMATAIVNYDDQLVINRYKDKEHVKETFEEYFINKVEKESKDE